VWVSTRADAQRAETGRSEPQAAEAERFDPLRSDSPWPETQQSSDPTAPMPRSVSADIIAEERAQTEEIARQLFASGEHSISQKNALDLARWASDEMGGHKTPARAAEQPKIAPALPATPMFTSATPRRMGRGALIAAIAVVVVAVVVMVIWALGGSSTDHPDEPGRPPQARSQPSPAPAPSQSEVTPEPAEAQAQAKPIEVAPQLTPSGPPQGPLTAEQLRRKLDEAKPALQLCVDRALPKEKVHVGRIHISTTIAPTGQVTAARIDKRTVDESALGTCLKRATQKITFPAFSGSPFDLDIPIVVTAGE
jgi:hypothetical protein